MTLAREKNLVNLRNVKNRLPAMIRDDRQPIANIPM